MKLFVVLPLLMAVTTVPAFAQDAAQKPAKTPESADAGFQMSLFTLDTPIETLIADKRSRAVLDKDLPGLSTDENLDKFKAMSLRKFQPMTGGQLTDAMMHKVAKDLAAIQ
ncbi:hypothetical protein FHR23_000509 [Stakelama sediminis]|uniref:Uncharacterized protein n=2 Tax=Stakelama sediminis TaxID=463200 RepID=A0A840YVK9_9SPHN|nr:hypothetical protein [Stakelama sediminis]MBB5717602.1 hypothetical protein [Stakelama sediminis]